ncbi:MAG: M42 family peptidase, partial [Clostridia bacterium]|nr:M42 family peptidase [Clostridia bacterium]
MLCEINGVSGAEDEVRAYIKEVLVGTEFDIAEDRMGNLFVRSEKAENAPSVILSAHMDEAGLIITSVTDDGYLKFDTIGEIPAASLLSKRVSIEGIPGIISAKAVHLLSKDDRSAPVKAENLFIDIGAASSAEAMAYVSPGDYCSFDNDFCHLGDDYISCKALSSRSGCEILVDILKSIDTEHINITAVFTTQKNISSRGMKTALNSIKDADLAIV